MSGQKRVKEREVFWGDEDGEGEATGGELVS